MKVKKRSIIGIALFIIIIIAIAASILDQRNTRRDIFAESITSHGRWNTPDSVRELRAAIAANERRVERHVQYAARSAHYWKLLSVRLQQRGLHGEALDALERAIYLSPEDPMLQYYTGISAGTLAKSFHLMVEGNRELSARQIADFSSTNRDSHRNWYFALAENAFLRAIELDPNYMRPRYSLGVLYVFELNRPEDAIPHLQRCLEVSRNDTEAMFVLARAFFMTRRYQEALELYDRIIILTGDEQRRIDAQNNRQIILGSMHG
jgi:tetratricopeptide (TPR) repeat protein